MPRSEHLPAASRLVPSALIIFVLSGAAGLTYESVWSRYLALLLGHSAYAQVLVLSLFMGGMAVGAAVAARYSERLRDPIAFYALAELTLGVVGLLFHPVYVAVSGAAYRHVFPALEAGPLLAAGKWTISGGLVLPQAVLLGTTFPLMAAGIIRRLPATPGRMLGLLYFGNSIGAAVGVLVAGFVLLAIGGLPGSVVTAAATNIAVAGLAFLLARRFPPPIEVPAPPASRKAATVASSRESRNNFRFALLAVSFGTAVASFAYEIGWIRMLSLVLGSATHSFEIMLSAFILGLALGAFWIRRRADTFRDPIRALGIVQWVMGAAALATLPLYGLTFDWIAWLLERLRGTGAGYVGFSVGKYGTSLLVMLPSTICAGMTLPLITRTLMVSGGQEKAIAEVYSANTLGSIVGAAAAGLLVLPAIGVRNLIIAGAALDMAIGVALIGYAAKPSGRRAAGFYGALGAAAALVALMALTPGVERETLAGGVYRYGTRRPAWLERVEFYRDGRTATVSVYRTAELDRLVIATNGKADGSLPVSWLDPCPLFEPAPTLSGDAGTQVLGALLTLAHAPRASAAAVIGHGTGMSTHFLLTSSELESLTTIEIEPQMIVGSLRFRPANRLAFEDGRSNLVIEDARTHFAANDTKYDVVFSEPSNPWVSGVASLFTEEFYALVADHLSDRGVLGQWLHLYEMKDDLVLTVLAALRKHFPHFSIYQTSNSDVMIVASKSLLPDPDWSVLLNPRVSRELCHVAPLRSADIRALWLADASTLEPLLYDWQPSNSDFHPVLDLGAERARFEGGRADGLLSLTSDGLDLAAVLSGRRRAAGEGFGAPSLLTERLVARSRALYLRGLTGSEDPDSIPSWGDIPDAVLRYQSWLDAMQTDRPPNDWTGWLEEFATVAEIRGAGLAGVPDTSLYRTAIRYAERHSAPLAVRRILAIYGSLDSWDFSRASADIDTLVSRVTDGSQQLGLPAGPVMDFLLEGGVVAKLAAGDTTGARAVYDALSPKYTRPTNDLRRRLVESLVSKDG